MSSKAVKHKKSIIRKSQELFRQAQFQSLYGFNSLDFFYGSIFMLCISDIIFAQTARRAI